MMHITLSFLINLPFVITIIIVVLSLSLLVWAIEPKMEVSTKSGEEKTQSAIVAGAGFAAFAALAGVVLTNLPDPNQF